MGINSRPVFRKTDLKKELKKVKVFGICCQIYLNNHINNYIYVNNTNIIIKFNWVQFFLMISCHWSLFM